MKYVTTESSTYIVDETNGYIVRLPGVGGEPIEGRTADVAKLRLDGEEIQLLEVVTLEVGQPMELVLDIRHDGIPTQRRTTIVRSIETVDATEAG